MKYLTTAVFLSLFFLLPLSGAEKLVFACDFSNGAVPQVSVQPCRPDPKKVQFIDVDGKKVLRVGKKEGKRAGRLSYFFGPQIKPQSLSNNQHPFPMRFGKLQFRFRPVGWKPKDPGYNMLLRMEGPLGTLLHVIYLCPRGIPSVQVAYGQQKNPGIGKGEIPVIYPYIDLDPEREWHDVTVIWDPSSVTLQIDGNKVTMSTRMLAYPGKDFYAERMYLGYGLSNLSLGETDIADLKIWATEPDKTAEQKKGRYPEITVNPMQAPVIDGKVSDEEWSKVSGCSGFLKLPKCNLSDYQPEVRAGYDRNNLYFSVVSKGHKRPPLRGETVRDGRVWKDDSIELYFASLSGDGNYHHIVLNHAGTVFDQYCQKGKNQSQQAAWNCKNLRSATEVSGSVWSTEIAIPFASLGMKTPVKGDVLLFNLCENIIGSGYYSLSSVRNRFAEYERFGILKFGDAGSSVVNFSDLGDLFRGDAAFRCSVSGKSAAQLEITAKRYDQTADTEFALFSEIVPVSAQPRICFKAGSDRLKKNGILYAVLRQKGDVLYSGRFFYESAMTAEIENMRREIQNGRNHLRVVTSHINDGRSRLRLLVSDRSGKAAAEKTVPVTGMKQTTFLDISKLPEGSYILSGTLLDGAGNVTQSLAGRDFTVYGKVPPWQGFVKKNFKLNRVPAPWTPLSVRKTGKRILVSCWNRVYTFGPKSLFAEKITTSGISLLKNPVKLLLKKDGVPAEIAEAELKIISSTARKVIIESCGKLSTGGKVIVSAEIDYDGFIWYQMKLDIPSGSRIDRLSVQFDMVRKHSALLNCGFRDLENTGSTPAYWNKSLEGISGPFWVGMEKGGLSFGIESTENWSNKKINTQAEVFREKSLTNIFLNIADKPVKIKKMPVYGFYLHPTPVRPRPSGYRKLRAQDWFSHNRAAARPETFYPANFSWWTTTWYYQGHPDWAVEHKDIAKVSRRLPKEYARNGKFFNFDKLDKKQTRSAWYAAYSSVGRNAPEVIWNGDSWLAGTQERLYGNTLYGYTMDMIEVCKTADYCDFYLWKFDQSKKAKPVIDGLYFDLWGPSACDRKDHNHGYTDPSGVRKPVFPVREHRRWLELIYLYCKEKADNAPIVCHVSGATAHIAGYSYADYLLDGELWFDKLARDRSYKSMSFDMARAEILPHIWGPGVLWLSELHRARGYVPAGQQKTWKLSPWAMRHLAGLLLLHDVLPDRTSLFSTAVEVWRALDKFKLSDQDILLPYWEKCGITGHNDRKNIAVTAYLKKNRKKMLMVVFNNYDYNFNTMIKLDVQKIFGTDARVKITDLETGRKLFSGVTRFTLPVPQRNFRLLQASVEK